MNFVTFGNTNEQVSELCLGTMMFGERCDLTESDQILGTAVDNGVNFIDTAAMYGGGRTEEILGKIIKGKRDKLFIGTKVHKGIDGKSIRESIDESLSRLQTDYVDLYMIHWPVQNMDPCEIMEALNDVVEQGKARYVGCCNYPAWLLAHSNAIAQRNDWAPLVCNQVAYNLFERGIEVEILPQAVADRIAITAYRPLAVGLLAGKYSQGQALPVDARGASDSRVITWLTQHGRAIDLFKQYAADLGIHAAQLAVAWVRHSRGVTAPIVGVSSLNQLKTAIDGFDFALTDAQYRQITEMFATEVTEEGFQLFPGLTYNFPRLRRQLNLLSNHDG